MQKTTKPLPQSGEVSIDLEYTPPKPKSHSFSTKNSSKKAFVMIESQSVNYNNHKCKKSSVSASSNSSASEEVKKTLRKISELQFQCDYGAEIAVYAEAVEDFAMEIYQLLNNLTVKDSNGITVGENCFHRYINHPKDFCYFNSAITDPNTAGQSMNFLRFLTEFMVAAYNNKLYRPKDLVHFIGKFESTFIHILKVISAIFNFDPVSSYGISSEKYPKEIHCSTVDISPMTKNCNTADKYREIYYKLFTAMGRANFNIGQDQNSKKWLNDAEIIERRGSDIHRMKTKMIFNRLKPLFQETSNIPESHLSLKNNLPILTELVKIAFEFTVATVFCLNLKRPVSEASSNYKRHFGHGSYAKNLNMLLDVFVGNNFDYSLAKEKWILKRPDDKNDENDWRSLAKIVLTRAFYLLFTGTNIEKEELDHLRRLLPDEIIQDEQLFLQSLCMFMHLLKRNKNSSNTKDSRYYHTLEFFATLASKIFSSENDFKKNNLPPHLDHKKILIIGDSLLRDQHRMFQTENCENVNVIALPGNFLDG